MIKIYLLFIALYLFSSLAFAGFDNQQMSFMLGSVTTSYAESSSNLQTDDADNIIPPSSGSASALPLDVVWEYYSSPKRSYFLRATVPLLSTSSDRYFFGGGGLNFYFKSISSKASYRDATVDLKFIPQWRYYWGLDAGMGFLVYNTGSQKKSDLIAELGGHLGILYSINSSWGAKVEAGYSMGNGVNTSTNNIKVLLGASYYLKD